MRLIIAALILCAATSASAQPYRVLVTLPGETRLPLALDTVATPVFELDAPASQVFSAVAAAMDELKIPIILRDADGGFVGNATLKQTYNFAGYQISRLLNCGLGATGPNANSYRVHMAVVAFIDPVSASRSRLRVAFAAGAIDMAGTSKEPTGCSSSGVLEQRLVDLVKIAKTRLP